MWRGQSPAALHQARHLLGTRLAAAAGRDRARTAPSAGDRPRSPAAAVDRRRLPCDGRHATQVGCWPGSRRGTTPGLHSGKTSPVISSAVSPVAEVRSAGRSPAPRWCRRGAPAPTGRRARSRRSVRRARRRVSWSRGGFGGSRPGTVLHRPLREIRRRVDCHFFRIWRYGRSVGLPFDVERVGGCPRCRGPVQASTRPGRRTRITRSYLPAPRAPADRATAGGMSAADRLS